MLNTDILKCYWSELANISLEGKTSEEMRKVSTHLNGMVNVLRLMQDHASGNEAESVNRLIRHIYKVKRSILDISEKKKEKEAEEKQERKLERIRLHNEKMAKENRLLFIAVGEMLGVRDGTILGEELSNAVESDDVEWFKNLSHDAVDSDSSKKAKLIIHPSARILECSECGTTTEDTKLQLRCDCCKKWFDEIQFD